MEAARPLLRDKGVRYVNEAIDEFWISGQKIYAEQDGFELRPIGEQDVRDRTYSSPRDGNRNSVMSLNEPGKTSRNGRCTK